MKLLIKQRVFSWTDTYDVYDEYENPVYYVKAEFFSLTHQLHVYDASGREVGIVKQRLFALLPTFDIVIDGYDYGTVQRKFTLLKPKYDIDYKGWRCEGDFLNWNYEVFSGNEPVVYITKEWFHWGDTYVLDVRYEQDEVMALMLAIAIDAANCTQNND
jgi:uncharacterized protein YxjI